MSLPFIPQDPTKLILDHDDCADFLKMIFIQRGPFPVIKRIIVVVVVVGWRLVRKGGVF